MEIIKPLRKDAGRFLAAVHSKHRVRAYREGDPIDLARIVRCDCYHARVTLNRIALTYRYILYLYATL